MIVDEDRNDFLQEASDEDEAEIEALIKKRVKEGSGRDYESIIKKDIVAYKKVKGHGPTDDEFSEFYKYEASKDYKKV